MSTGVGPVTGAASRRNLSPALCQALGNHSATAVSDLRDGDEMCRLPERVGRERHWFDDSPGAMHPSCCNDGPFMAIRRLVHP